MYINWKHKELIVTLALFGPQGSGKSTTWRYWARSATTLPTAGDDTFSLRLENIQGKQLLLNLRDTPGAETATSQRRVSLYGVDGVIFVADAHPERQEANRQSLSELQANLAAMQRSIHNLPLFMQYNKQDLLNALPVATLHRLLNPEGLWPYQTTSAIHTQGLIEALKQATDLVLRIGA